MNNERYYLLTGAAGFLGTNICMQLLEKGCKVRALVLPNDKSVKYTFTANSRTSATS